MPIDTPARAESIGEQAQATSLLSTDSLLLQHASGQLGRIYGPDLFTQIRSDMFDFVVDSNAKLDAWIGCINGSMKRVLVKAGTWSASALGPASTSSLGILLDLVSAGTIQVIGEPGSKIVYSGLIDAPMRGLYYAAIPAMSLGHIVQGLSVELENTRNGGYPTAEPFYGLRNVRDCSALAKCPNNPLAFSHCNTLINNKGVAGVSGVASASTVAFYSCRYLLLNEASAYNTGANTAYTYFQCNNMLFNRFIVGKDGNYACYADDGTANGAGPTYAGGFNFGAD
jgi:hypothetical protein